MVYVLGMEIIEKLWYGSGVIHYLIKDHEYTSTYFPGFFRNYFFY